MAASVIIRGPRRSLQLFAASAFLAAGAEIIAIRGTRILRHHTRPQIAELPLTIPLGWYGFIAPAYGLAQAAVGDRGPTAVACVTALLATATDVANDPWGLASGFWEWRDGGPYMPDIVGSNGVAGIPVGNYAGWLIIAASAALLGEIGRPPGEIVAARRLRSPLLFLYLILGLAGIGWAGKERRWRLLAASITTVVGGGTAAWLKAQPIPS